MITIALHGVHATLSDSLEWHCSDPLWLTFLQAHQLGFRHSEYFPAGRDAELVLDLKKRYGVDILDPLDDPHVEGRVY